MESLLAPDRDMRVDFEKFTSVVTNPSAAVVDQARRVVFVIMSEAPEAVNVTLVLFLGLLVNGRRV